MVWGLVRPRRPARSLLTDAGCRAFSLLNGLLLNERLRLGR
jgi:hypothetical protein